MQGTNLQEGDVCRRLRRVMDMLRQTPRLPIISEGIKLCAKRALTLMDRFPVADDVTYTVSGGEKIEDMAEEGGATDEEYIQAVVDEQDLDADNQLAIDMADMVEDYGEDEGAKEHRNGAYRTDEVEEDEEDDELMRAMDGDDSNDDAEEDSEDDDGWFERKEESQLVV